MLFFVYQDGGIFDDSFLLQQDIFEIDYSFELVIAFVGKTKQNKTYTQHKVGVIVLVFSSIDFISSK